jgi:hypothetical protein
MLFVGKYSSALCLVVLAASTALLAGCSDGSGPALESTAAAAEWCNEHEVEEKFCILCHPEIKNDPNILLCKEHYDIPEDICTACHPELKSKYKTCPHELPVAFCQECQKLELK